ncbi:MAG: P-loop NTPase [Kofleriaceae bacterium]
MAKLPRRIPRIIAVAGGKGGVGKSTVAANLAVGIGRLGTSVTLVDADLGAANLTTMFGELHPTATLADFLDHRTDVLDELVMRVAPAVGLVPGTSRPGAANFNNGQKLRLLKAIARVSTECVIVDVGAGSSYNVIDLLAAADHKLLVITPQLPSLHNAYALLKATVHRIVRKLSADETHRSLIDAALANEGKARTIPQLLAVLRPLDARLADVVADSLQRFGIGLVGNQLADGDERALGRMSALIHDHLLVHAPMIGAVPHSLALSGGLKAGGQTIAGRADACSRAFTQLARTILETDLGRLRGEQRSAMHQTMPLWIQRELQGP